MDQQVGMGIDRPVAWNCLPGHRRKDSEALCELRLRSDRLRNIDTLSIHLCRVQLGFGVPTRSIRGDGECDYDCVSTCGAVQRPCNCGAWTDWWVPHAGASVHAR